jgi:hypothetical protein
MVQDRRTQLRYEKRWRLARAEGKPTSYIDGNKVRAHIQQLLEWDCSLAAIANAAGVATSPLSSLMTGGHANVQRRTGDAVLALSLHDVIDRAKDQHYLPRWAAQRRVHALMAIGHTHESITAHLRPGLRSTNITGPAIARAPYLRAHTWRDVDRVFEELSSRPGVSDLSRLRAFANGWAAPLAYDDIDDPNEHPVFELPADPLAIDEVAVQRASDGIQVPLTAAERAVVVAAMTRDGHSAKEIGERLRVAPRTVTRYRVAQRQGVAA